MDAIPATLSQFEIILFNRTWLDGQCPHSFRSVNAAFMPNRCGVQERSRSEAKARPRRLSACFTESFAERIRRFALVLPASRAKLHTRARGRASSGSSASVQADLCAVLHELRNLHSAAPKMGQIGVAACVRVIGPALPGGPRRTSRYAVKSRSHAPKCHWCGSGGAPGRGGAMKSVMARRAASAHGVRVPKEA